MNALQILADILSEMYTSMIIACLIGRIIKLFDLLSTVRVTIGESHRNENLGFVVIKMETGRYEAFLFFSHSFPEVEQRIHPIDQSQSVWRVVPVFSKPRLRQLVLSLFEKQRIHPLARATNGYLWVSEDLESVCQDVEDL